MGLSFEFATCLASDSKYASFFLVAALYIRSQKCHINQKIQAMNRDFISFSSSNCSDIEIAHQNKIGC